MLFCLEVEYVFKSSSFTWLLTPVHGTQSGGGNKLRQQPAAFHTALLSLPYSSVCEVKGDTYSIRCTHAGEVDICQCVHL